MNVYIISLKDEVDLNDAVNALKSKNVEVLSVLRNIKVIISRMDPNKVNEIKKLEFVKSVDVNREIRLR